MAQGNISVSKVQSRFAETRFAETRFAETRFAETFFAETRFAETPILTLTLNPNFDETGFGETGRHRFKAGIPGGLAISSLDI